jgi:hypothetical protein
MAKIFISYSRANQDIASLLYEDLRDHEVFMDTESLRGGQRWWEKITDQIRDSNFFFYLDTKEARKSLFCQAELEWAKILNRYIVPIRIAGEQITTQNSELDSIQAIIYDMKSEIRLTPIQNAILNAFESKSLQKLPKPIPKSPESPLKKIEAFVAAMRAKINSQNGFSIPLQREVVAETKARIKAVPLEESDHYKQLLEELRDHPDIIARLKEEIVGLLMDLESEVPIKKTEDKTLEGETIQTKYSPAYQDLVTSVQDGNIIPFLGPGLTPSIYYAKLEAKIADLVGSFIFNYSWDDMETSKIVV